MAKIKKWAIGSNEEVATLTIRKPLASCSSDRTIDAVINEEDLKALIRIFKKMGKHIEDEGEYFRWK